MHKLLERQLRKLAPAPRPPGIGEFLAAVDAAYHQADRDREQAELCLGLASEELLERNRQLREDIERRKRLELELSQAEKMRAVGQLASGIAHELNTPIQYVGDNVTFLQRAFQSLSGLLDEAISREPPGKARTKLDFLRKNIPEAIAAAIEGCQRVAEIVSAMKEFAHPDDGDFYPADVNRALSCTLAVARNAVRDVADVRLDLGVVPEIECRVGDLNHVFLNLITNAAHAISEKNSGGGARGHIDISTRLRGDRVLVEVADDGAGIPEAIQSRVFEPFFTTKEVGRGTGQGLAVCRSIVADKHGGAIYFRTSPGMGTTFTVELPVRRPAERAPADGAR